ncbi:hypothetical protein AWV79_35740 [Cupriavidus sp. UYMMa02A]|nr:hypothetical protein AWV79_35740 [Cupriavidus sp. UYMMa02A]
MDVISPEHEQEYFKRARTFEVGLLEKAEQTNKRLWLALAAVIVLCCCAVAAVLAVVSMKEVFPFLITQYSDGRIETTDMTSNPQRPTTKS